ncbi:MAG TPA: hypothetical protein VMW38_19425, partial [Terriglobia bacterium]|nr:hypothetical protein [Terriglobia bacterium]
AIKDVDSRTQAGIQTVQTKTNEVDQKAATATQKAEESQQLAQNNQTKINTKAHGYCQERSNRGYQNSIFMKDLTMKFYPQQESLFHSRTLAPVVATLIPIPVLDTGH